MSCPGHDYLCLGTSISTGQRQNGPPGKWAVSKPAGRRLQVDWWHGERCQGRIPRAHGERPQNIELSFSPWFHDPAPLSMKGQMEVGRVTCVWNSGRWLSLNREGLWHRHDELPGKETMRIGADNQDLRIRKGRDLAKTIDKEWPKHGRKTRRVWWHWG